MCERQGRQPGGTIPPADNCYSRKMPQKHKGQRILRLEEPLPMDGVRQVDHPTTYISDSVQRIDMRDTAYGLAARGKYGPAAQKGVQRILPARYPLSAAQADITNHIASLPSNPVAPELAPIPHEPAILTHHMKSLGYFLKADLVRVCKVPLYAYYSHDKQGNPVQPRYEYAIVIVMRKDWQAIYASTGSDWMGDPISFQAYQHLALVAETIANYIRRLGWEASANYGPSLVDRYEVLLPPLLLLSGVGEISRAGIVLNPYLGLAFKAAAVLTTMPLLADKPVDFGLQDFCNHCRICAESCPSGAIPKGDKVLYNGYETWKLDTKRCASFNFARQDGTICNRCVKVCPWTRPMTWPHQFMRWVAMRSRVGRRFAIRLAYWTGLAKSHPERQWWFDMEYVGTVITSRERTRYGSTGDHN